MNFNKKAVLAMLLFNVFILLANVASAELTIGPIIAKDASGQPGKNYAFGLVPLPRGVARPADFSGDGIFKLAFEQEIKRFSSFARCHVRYLYS